MVRFENNLGKVRRFRKLKQSEVSEETGIPISTLRKWEQGVNSPPADMLMKLANYYRVNTDTLLFPGYPMPGQSFDPSIGLADDEKRLVEAYRALTDEGRLRLMEYASDLVASGRYRRQPGDGAALQSA